MSEIEDLWGDLIASAIEGAYGERCPTSVEGCAVCEAWKQYDNVIGALTAIRDFPKEDYKRRTADGYPSEIVFDEWAYRRLVDNYREAAKAGLKNHAPEPFHPSLQNERERT